jgi:hypothetical protein
MPHGTQFGAAPRLVPDVSTVTLRYLLSGFGMSLGTHMNAASIFGWFLRNFQSQSDGRSQK